ncbi:SIR2 family protein [Pelatocladus sp. BLCC-F211]|uniref:SIR2 family protein n=1 Tax=Pelatocladus sp. BLCC-F211 TaxID=3342752 RepID=UPI0035B88EE1
MASQEPQSPLDTWKEKLAFFQNEEARTANPAQKFDLEKQIKECKQKIDELTKEGTGRSIISPVPNPVNEQELSKHFQEVAKSLRNGSLIFFLGSGINLTKDSNLPPSDRQIADELSLEKNTININNLIGFPCEICPFKMKEGASENESIFKPDVCPVLTAIGNNSQLIDEQRLREAKLELRCRAQYFKDILPLRLREIISRESSSKDLENAYLHNKLSSIFRKKDYKFNPLQKSLADLVLKIKERINTDPDWENPYQVIATTTYDWGLELAFESNEQDIDVLSYIAHGEVRGKFKYIRYRIPEKYDQSKKEYSQNELNSRVLNTSNKDSIIDSLKEIKFKKTVGLDRPIIIKLYGGTLYKLENQDSFFIPEIHHNNYLRDSKDAHLKLREILPSKLIMHWNNSQILFIGYSANDPDLRAILDYFRNTEENPSYPQNYVKGWLIHQSSHPGDLNEETYWKNHWGIELIEYSWKDYVEQLKEMI